VGCTTRGVGQNLSIQFPDIIENGNAGPMLRQYPLAERIDLAKRHGFKSARAFKANTKSADSGKQVQDLELFHVN
jgi:hypothetical protein|tara:strand:- start:3414 stop:3638 length:225 start_codon:yes stop_codon:yes gene_type:complete